MNLSEDFWDSSYKDNNIGWDLGEISTPLKDYFDQLEDEDIKILIPGGGNSYEAEYLHAKGFKNVYVVDLSETALANIIMRVPTFPKTQLIHNDFFQLQMTFDLIVEQTFFCAINPKLRQEYVLKTYELLNDGKSLVGLLFNVPLNQDHPPFGGNKEEYLTYFESQFEIKIMEDCYNSIESRKGRELFIKLVKK